MTFCEEFVLSVICTVSIYHFVLKNMPLCEWDRASDNWFKIFQAEKRFLIKITRRGYTLIFKIAGDK